MRELGKEGSDLCECTLALFDLFLELFLRAFQVRRVQIPTGQGFYGFIHSDKVGSRVRMRLLKFEPATICDESAQKAANPL